MKISPIFFLLLFFTTFGFVYAQTDVRASAAWSVLRYDINSTLPQNYANRFLGVRANLNLKNVGNAIGTRLTLRISEKAEVATVRIGDAVASFQKSEEKLSATRNLQRIVVSIPSTPIGGTLSLTVEYKLKVEDNNGLNALSPAGSQFLPLSFWYPTPTNHFAPRGADFAPFSISVNGGTDELISSGERRSKDVLFDQKLIGQPFFLTGIWDQFDAKGVSFFLPKGATDAEKNRATEIATVVSDAKAFYLGLLGSGTELPIRVVAVKRGAGFSDAGTILVEYGAFRRTKLDSNTVMVIAEALAKTWLGNKKIVRGEGFGVIREGLARYLATQFLERQFGKDAAEIERLRQRTSYASVSRRDSPLINSAPIDDFYYASVANKGAMVWRMLAKQIGDDELFRVMRSLDALTLSNVRAAFSLQKTLLDYVLDQTTDTNLLVGLPQLRGTETVVAVRNLGSIDANVNVVAKNEAGEKFTAAVSIPALNFGQAIFRTTSKLVRVEIDPEKYFPQTDFSDDIAPREFTESDALLVIKRSLDKQDFVGAEKNARTVLRQMPNFEDARIFLARSLAAQNKIKEAEQEFRSVLNEKLPTARSLAWANVGLGEIVSPNNPSQAARYFDDAINCDAEYGATLAAREGRNKLSGAPAIDSSVKEFFAQFDKAAISASKSNVEALTVPGEIARFSSGISGQAQVWQTRVTRIDRIDANTIAVETTLNVRLLNRNDESGTAVFQLTRIGGAWKLSAVEAFEVR